MADNSIQFKIGSTFTGEGFTKAQQAVGSMRESVSKTTGALTQISTAMGTMDGQAATMVRSVTGLLGAFQALNPVTIAISTSMLAYNEAMKITKQRCDELLDRVNSIRDAVQNALQQNLTSKVSGMAAEIQKVNAEMKTVTDQAKAFTDALNGLNSSNATGEIIKLQTEKFQAKLDAASEAAGQLSDAEYDLKIKVVESNNKIEAANQALEGAKTALANNESALSRATSAREAAEAEFQRCEQNFSIVAANYEKGQAEYTAAEKALNEAKNHLATTTNAEDAARKEGTTLLVKLQTAEQNRENVIAATNLEIEKSKEAIKKLNEDNAFVRLNDTSKTAAADLEAVAEEERKFAESHCLQSLKESYDALKAEVDKEKDSKKALQEAEANYKKALEEYNSNIQNNSINEAFSNYFGKNSALSSLLKSGTLPVDIQKSIQTKVADQKVDDAIRNGMVNTVKEADRMRRIAEREARDAISKESGQRAKEAQKYETLMKTPKKDWSKSDVKFVETYEKIQEASEAQKKKLDETKIAMDKANEKRQLQEEKVNQAQKDLANKVQQMSGKIDFPAVTRSIDNMKQALADCVKLS